MKKKLRKEFENEIKNEFISVLDTFRRINKESPDIYLKLFDSNINLDVKKSVEKLIQLLEVLTKN